MFKKTIIFILVLFILFIQIDIYADDTEEDMHVIEYLVQNSEDSYNDMFDISIPIENIESADFINITGITPNNETTIPKGAGQLYNIFFTIDQGQDVSPSDNITIRLNHDQLIEPTEDIVTVSDKEPPILEIASITPRCQLADTISELRFRLFLTFKDGWSGVDPDSEISLNGDFSVEDLEFTVTDGGGAELECIIRPYRNGTYPIYLEGVEDFADNDNGFYLGSYTVRTIIIDPNDPPVFPDESYDVFDANPINNQVLDFGETKTAILDSGYSLDMLSLLASFAEDADLISVEDFTPGLVDKYSFLVIPSASLVEAKNISNMKEKLTEFVNRGGNLLVLPQTTDDCYDILPDKVEGIGYYQDKACYNLTALVSIDNPAFAGQTGSELEGTVDGAITSWPENTEVWLRRIKNNYPALISYQVGQGRVIVSNYYSDFAYSQSQLKEGERRFIRDLISWGRDFADLPLLSPGNSEEIIIPVYYEEIFEQETSVDKLRLIVRDPDRNILETFDYPVSLEPGENIEQTFSFDDSTNRYSGIEEENLGIWWVNYELYQDDTLVQQEVEGERLALKIDIDIPEDPEIAVAVKPLVDDALAGSAIPFEIIIKNESDQEQTIDSSIMFRTNNSSSPDFFQTSGLLETVQEMTYTLVPGETQTDTVELEAGFVGVGNNNSFNRNWWVFDFYDTEGNRLVRDQRGIRVYKPAVNVKYDIDNSTRENSDIFYPGNEVEMDLYIENQILPEYPIEWTFEVVDPEGNIIYEDNGFDELVAVAAESYQFNLPDDAVSGNYQIKFDIASNEESIIASYEEDELTVADLYLGFDSFSLAENSLICNIENTGLSDIDYSFLYTLMTEDDEILHQEEYADTITMESTKTVELPAGNINNYFEPYYANIDMGELGTKIIEFTPYQLEIRGVDDLQTRSRNLNYDLSIINKNLRTENLKLVISSGLFVEDYIIELPDLEKDESISETVEVELKNNLSPGTYAVNFMFEDMNFNRKYSTYSLVKVEQASYEVNIVEGDTGIWGIELVNNEEEELILDYSVSLHDVQNDYKNESDRISITEQGSETINAAESMVLEWPLASLKEGEYLISYDVNTLSGINSNKGIEMINIAGNAVDMNIEMNTDRYFSDEDILSTLQIQNNEYPFNGEIDLYLKQLSVSGQERSDGWSAVYGDESRKGYSSVAGNINDPSVLWSNNNESTGLVVSGDIMGDSQNELVYLNDTDLTIARGRSAYIVKEIPLDEMISDFENINIILADIDSNDKSEIFLINNTSIYVFDDEGVLLWSRSDFDNSLTPLYTAIDDINGDQELELLTGNYLIKAEDGEIIREDAVSGIAVDINNDGEVNIVNGTAIYDSDFTLLFENTTVAVSADSDIVPADINQDGNEEIIIQEGNHLYTFDHQYNLIWSYTDPDINLANRFNVFAEGQAYIVASWETVSSGEYKILVFNNNGSVLWEKIIKNSINHLICDINGDENIDIVISEGSYLSAYELLSGEVIWSKFLNIVSNIILTDTTGDHSTEIIADLSSTGISCIGNIETEDSEVVYSLSDERSSARYSGLTWPKSLILEDGSLWFIGNECISYYLPDTDEYDIIPLETKTASLALRYEEELIKLYDLRNSLYRGYVDPETRNYTEVNEARDSITIYDQNRVYDNKQYFLHNYESGTAFYVEDLSTGQIEYLGALSGHFDTIIGIIDEGENMLVNALVDGGSVIAKIDIQSFSGTGVASVPSLNSIDAVKWADDNTVFLYTNSSSSGGYNNALFRYNLDNNNASKIFDSETFEERFEDMGIYLNTFVNFEPIDANNLYLMTKDFSNYTHLPVNASDLLRYNILTDTLEVVTEVNEYASISTIEADTENIYFSYYQFDGELYSYNKNTGQVNEYSAPAEIKSLIREYNLKPKKIIVGESDKIFLLTEADTIHDASMLGITILFDNNEYYLFEIDLYSEVWSTTSFNYDNENNPFNFYHHSSGLATNASQLADITIDTENRLVYASGIGRNENGDMANIVVKHELGSTNFIVVDSAPDLYKSIYYDNNNDKLYYHLNNEFRIYDPQNEEISIEEGLSGKMTDYELYFLGTSGEDIYFYDFTYSNLFGNTSLYAVYPRIYVNIYKYTSGQDDLLLVNHFYTDSQYFYQGFWDKALKWQNLTFDSDSLSLYRADGQDILRYDLSEDYQYSILDNSIYEYGQLGFNENIVEHQNLPLELEANSVEELDLTFSPVGQRGLYELQGLVYNDLGQLMEEKKEEIIVGGNIPVVELSTEEYYQSGEYLNLTAVLTNDTDEDYQELGFTVQLTDVQESIPIFEDEITLMSSEQRSFNISSLLQDEGEYIITASLMAQDGRKLFEIHKKINVSSPEIGAEVDIPEFVGSDPFYVELNIENTGYEDLSLNVASELFDESSDIYLRAGQEIYLSEEIQVAETTDLIVNISGDLNETISEEIVFAEDAEVEVQLAELVSDSITEIPFILRNTGQVNADIPLNITLYRQGEILFNQEVSLFVETAQEKVYQQPVELEAGSYRLQYSTPYNQNEKEFECVENYDADISVSQRLTDYDNLELDINISNTGFQRIRGEAAVSLGSSYQEYPVDIVSDESHDQTINLSGLPLEKGEYEIEIDLYNRGALLKEETITFVREETINIGPEIVLSEYPDEISIPVGESADLSIQVSNIGKSTGNAVVEFYADPLCAYSETVELTQDESEDVIFSIPVPTEYESGDYQGRIIIGDNSYTFDYHVEGYQIDAEAYLDKSSYILGDTAVLTIDIENQCNISEIPLIVRVNHGDFDMESEVSLNSNSSLDIEIPAENFNEKIFYGIYLEDSERSLFLNSIHMQESHPEFSLTSDKEVYQPGEDLLLNVNIDTEEAQWLVIHGPGDFYETEKVDTNRAYNIPLPDDIKTGTYTIYAQFGNQMLDYKINVLGPLTYFVSADLDKEIYEEGDSFTLDTVYDCVNDSLETTVDIELLKFDGSKELLMTEEDIILSNGENHLSFAGEISSEQPGIHWLKISLKTMEGYLLTTNRVAFTFGAMELNSITTEKEAYPGINQDVEGKVNLFGYGSGDLLIYLDGNLIEKTSVEAGGTLSVPYTIAANDLGTGRHTVSAEYIGEQNSREVSCEFEYGSELADLYVEDIEINKERTIDDKITLTVSVSKENTLAAENIPVVISIDNEIIAEYTIASLEEEGEVHQKTILWDTEGFTGQGELMVEIDPENTIVEYSEENNTDSIDVDIPAVPELQYLPDIINQSTLSLSGNTVAEGFVRIYLDNDLVATVRANESGQFVSEEFTLSQGEHILTVDVLNQKLFESLTLEKEIFVDSVEPKIVIANIREDQCFKEDVLPEISVEDTNLESVEYLLNGAVWDGENLISEEGDYSLSIRAVDIAENISEKAVNFTIDKTVPGIEVSGVEDQGYYNSDISPVINVLDDNPDELEVSLDGLNYDDEPVSAEGRHLLIITASDKAGNRASNAVRFVIDKTAPLIDVTGIEDGGVYSEPVSIEITTEDEYLLNKEVLLNGEPYQSGTPIELDGENVLTVRAEDLAGNIAELEYTFTLDLEAGFEMESSLDSVYRVLMYNPSGNDSVDVLQAILADHNIDSTVSYTSTDFLNKLDTNSYNLYLLIDGGNFIYNGQYDDKYLANIPGIRKLLKEKISSGHNMLYVYGGSQEGGCFLMQDLGDLIGASYQGNLPHYGWTANFEENIGVSIAAEGRILNAGLNTAEEYGYIELNHEEVWHQYIGDPVYPALIKNSYGDGRVYSMMFNPLFSNPDDVDERMVVEEIVDDLTPEYDGCLASNSLFAVSTEISSLENESYQLRHVVELPAAGFTALEDNGYSREGNMLVQEFTIQSGEIVHLDALAVTADEAGVYDLHSRLYYHDEESGWQLAEDIVVNCQVE